MGCFFETLNCNVKLHLQNQQLNIKNKLLHKKYEQTYGTVSMVIL